jgi:EmrB/QacA subfamily drug resistance transporter
MVILMAPFMAYVDIFIVTVANPSIEHGLHATSEQIQFVVAGYSVAYAVNLITAGRLGDTYGRKRIFMIGMAGFTITSVFCAFAPNALTLIVTRVFQGATAAIMFPKALSIIQATFSSRQKNTAIALYGATIATGGAAGLVLGGFLIQTNLFNLDWRLIFLVNVPIGIGTLIAALRIVHESKSEKPVGLDIGGAAIMSVILFLLLFPLVEGRDVGWPLWMYVAIISSVILIIPFILFERRLSSSPKKNIMDYDKAPNSNFKPRLSLIPLSLFKDRSFVLGTSIIILFYMGYTGFTFFLTFYLQYGLGFSPLAAGLTFLPLGIGFVISSLLTPKIIPKLEIGTMKIGTIITITSFVFLIIAAYQESNIGSQLPLFMFVLGIGNGFALIPLINVIISRAKTEDAGAASGVLNTMIAVGTAMGIAFIGSIFFGVIGNGASSAASDIWSHAASDLTYHIRVHHYTDALVSSTLYTISLIIVTLILISLLGSIRSKAAYYTEKSTSGCH